jgi:hypothetical protein
MVNGRKINSPRKIWGEQLDAEAKDAGEYEYYSRVFE